MTKKELEAQNKRYERAIRWALGELGEFRTREDGEGGFWWRTELHKRAGLVWDRKRERYVPRAADRVSTEVTDAR